MRTPCGMCGARAVEEAIAEMETTTSRREFLALLRKGYVDAIASHEEIMRLLNKTNELSREIAQTILTEAGLQVVSVENGKLAVDYMAQCKPGFIDLVLMDIMMPVMDGYAATRAIRALNDPAIANVPIIAMTANAFDEDVRTALRAGMDAHFAKPIEIAKLEQMLYRYLSEK